MAPDIILFDEPTSDLDPQGTKEIIDTIYKLAKDENKAIILIEHKLQDVIDIIDRVYIMNEGQFIIHGKPEDVFNKNIDIIEKLGIDIPYKFKINNVRKKVSDEYRFYDNYNIRKDKNKDFSQNNYLLCIHNMNFKYSEELVLKNISLKIKKGEFIALLGRNGSGKTTLVKNIIGLLKPTSGTILFKGMDIKKKKVQYLSKYIGYLYQNPSYQIFKNTVYEELAFGLKNLKLKKEIIKSKIENIAQKLELNNLLERNTYTLSRGQSQRVALASILILEPELLILDEPTTGQDYRNRKNILELAKKLNEDEITIILITHDIDLAYEYATRIIILENGQIFLDGTPEEVFSNKELLEMLGFRIPKIFEVAK